MNHTQYRKEEMDKMQKIENKIGNTIYSFQQSEFNGKPFLSMTKATPAFQKDGKVIVKAKFQNLTCKIQDLPEFKEFLKRVIAEG
jgi:hypothetical protein